VDLENVFTPMSKKIYKSTWTKKMFSTPGWKIFTSPRGLRKLFTPCQKYLQVHVDLENFCHPQVEKNLQVHMENHKYCIRKNKCEKIFTSPPGLRKFVHPHVKNILQVHKDLENFLHLRLKKYFTSPRGLRKLFLHPRSKNIYKTTWT